VQVLARELQTRNHYRWDAHGEELTKAILRRLRSGTSRQLKKALEDIPKGKTSLSREWEHKVTFRVRVYSTVRGEFRIYAEPWTNKEIWHWVSRGTPPHIIEAKNAKALVFQWGFARYKPPPKSYPRMAILPGGGDVKTVAFKRVHHPGSDPRNFEERLLEENIHLKAGFRKDVRQGIEDWEKAWSVFR